MNKQEKLAEGRTIVYEELLLPEETEVQREKNRQLFRDNLELILANSELILKTPEFFYIRHQWSLVGGSYVGVKYIPLGVLIKLWKNGEWLGECNKCGQETYVYSAGGSPLNGGHYTNAVCIHCREFVDQQMGSGLALLLKPALGLCSAFTQRRKILRSRGPIFSWSRGFVGKVKSVPDKILREVVQPVELEVMIASLSN